MISEFTKKKNMNEINENHEINETLKTLKQNFELYIKEKNQNEENILNNILLKTSRCLKNYSLIFLYESKIIELPNEIDVPYIISQLKAKSLIFYQFKPKLIYYFQEISRYLTKLIQTPQHLAGHIKVFLANSDGCKSSSQILFFLYSTLPSIFNFYTIPDILPYAESFALYLFSPQDYENNSGKDYKATFADYFCSTFFIYSIKFIQLLWDDYIDKLFFGDIKKHPIDFFSMFLDSLKKASAFLENHHFTIMEKLYNTNKYKFIWVMIKLVFEPTLNVRLKHDGSSHIYESSNVLCFKNLKNIFDYILNTNLDTFSKILFQAMHKKFTVSPKKVGSINLQKYFIQISLAEIIFFQKIIHSQFINALNTNDQINDKYIHNFDIFFLEIFLIHREHSVIYVNEYLFLHDFLQSAYDKTCNIKNDKIATCIGNYSKKLVSFEKFLFKKIIIQNYKNMFHIIQTNINILINNFPQILSKKSIQYNLLQVKPQETLIYNKTKLEHLAILYKFTKKLADYNIDTSKYRNIFKKINIHTIQNLIKMDIIDQIICFPRISNFISQHLFHEGFEDNTKEFYLHYINVLFQFDNKDFFFSLIDDYILFFLFVYKNYKEKDPFYLIVQNEWCRMKKILKFCENDVSLE